MTGQPFKYDDSDPTKPTMWIQFDEYELVNLVEMMKALDRLKPTISGFDNGDWYGQFVDKLISSLNGIHHGVDKDQFMVPNRSAQETLDAVSASLNEMMEQKLQELIQAASTLLGTKT